mmetsp:Transcript_66231/g.115920  ORF Transcript_66231/g.115920 Transcript_66231/m.115920 type:complete len:135 (+) Transcript_66231:67-471(+)
MVGYGYGYGAPGAGQIHGAPPPPAATQKGGRDNCFGLGHTPTPQEMRDEQYADYVKGVYDLTQDWQAKRLTSKEAYNRIEPLMESIRKIRVVDRNRAIKNLERRGMTEDKRIAMDRSYQELKKLNRKGLNCGCC